MFSCIRLERMFLRCCDCEPFFSSSLWIDVLGGCWGILAISGKRPTISSSCSLDEMTTCFISRPIDWPLPLSE